MESLIILSVCPLLKKNSSETKQSRTVPAFKDKLLSGHNASEAPSGHNTKQLTLNTSLHATTETIQNYTKRTFF